MVILKKKLYPLFVFCLLISCKSSDNKLIFEEFISGYYNEGFNSIENLLADSVTIADIGDFSVKYSKNEYKTLFQWDSVFNPQHKLIKISQVTDSTVEIIQSVSSERFEFLKNSPLITCKKYYFEKGRITRIENIEYLNVDWTVWTSQRDSLVSWIEKNHKELSGFIYDQTLKGAENYLHAIELYKKEE